MASTTVKIRLVRCPNCLKLLTEFADVPVYKCGVCRTVLRAKYHDTDGENLTPGSIQTSSLQKSLSSNGKVVCHEKGKSSDFEANDIEEKGFVTNPDGMIQPKTEYHLNEEALESLKLSEKLEVPSESLTHNAASEDSFSSLNDKYDDLHDRYRLLPRRTFRHRTVLPSVDTEGKEGGDELEVRNLSLGSSLDTEDSHSVPNWKEYEKVRPARSLSKDSAFFRKHSFKHQNGSTYSELKNLEQDRIELLRKLDEVRDQLSGLYDHRGEVKERSQFRRSFPAYHRPQQYQLPCLHCHMEPNFYCNNGLCRAYYAHDICCHSLKAKIPYQPINPGLPPRRLKSQTHNKGQRQPIKHHCRPIGNGAPFVICYKCLSLLQMPADFLVSRRRSHKLQCGACSQVLVLSFPARAREIAQILTEVDPVSFTEEYGLSFSKSCSAEAEPELAVSRNSSEEGKGKQALGPPLHWLMGYPSASKLIYPIDDGDEGCKSSEVGRWGMNHQRD